MRAAIHTFLIGLTAKAVRLLPQPLHRALDGWSQRVARERALRRQKAIRRKA